jgi:molybdopterin converting factor small subunit
MRVTVRYHALLREKTGLSSEAFEIAAASARVSDVLAAFVARHGAFERLAPSLHVAIADEIVSREHPVCDNESLDLMPPFGGG